MTCSKQKTYNKYLPRTIAVAVLLCSLVTLPIMMGCGKKPETPLEVPETDAATGMKRHIDEEVRYYFEYPSSWSEYGSEQMNLSENQRGVLISPLPPQDTERLSINFIGETYERVDMTIDQKFIDELKAYYGSNGQEIVSLELGKVQNQYAASVASLISGAEKKKLHTRQYIFIAGTRLIIATLQGTEKNVKKAQSTFNDILDSVHFAK